MLGCIVEGIGRLLLEGLLRLVLLPLVLVVATPVVLVAALFGPDAYAVNVRNGYGRVLELWGCV